MLLVLKIINYFIFDILNKYLLLFFSRCEIVNILLIYSITTLFNKNLTLRQSS